MTPEAIYELNKLQDYIAHTLKAPETALSYIISIRNKIESLSTMPERNKLIEKEPFYSRGIRKMIANNSYIYYRIDKDTMCIYILNIIYAKRDQLEALTKTIII